MRLEKIRRFLAEADRLKHVERRSVLTDGSRFENTAEHTWHALLFALLLHGELAGGVDLLQVLRLLIVHDLVEIDAGDTYAYDDAARADQRAREERAAERLFGLLPADLAARLRALWDEFERGATPEARFARSCDMLQPLGLNVASGGRGWQHGGITRDRVLDHNGARHDHDPATRAFFDHLIARADEGGMFADP